MTAVTAARAALHTAATVAVDVADHSAPLESFAAAAHVPHLSLERGLAVPQSVQGVRNILITVADRGAISEAPRYLGERLGALGHHADIVRTSELVVDPAGAVLHNGAPLPEYDTVIARGGAELTAEDIDKLRAIERTGVPVLNPPDAIAIAGDKWKTAQALAAVGAPHPVTALIEPTTDAAQLKHQVATALAMTRDTPLVIKPVADLGGNGVVFVPGRGDLTPAHYEASVRSLIDDKLPRTNKGLLVQQWITEATGRDRRVFFVRDGSDFRVTGAYERVAPEGVGTANVSKGATANPVTPDPEMVRIAKAAAEQVGLRSGAVDFIQTNEGWKVIETNSSAGVRAGTEHDAGGDVAGALVQQALESAAKHVATRASSV